MVRGPTPYQHVRHDDHADRRHQHREPARPMSRRHTAVTSTVAVSSHVSRSNSSRLMCRGRSATTVASILAPGRPCRANSSTLATGQRAQRCVRAAERAGREHPEQCQDQQERRIGARHG